MKANRCGPAEASVILLEFNELTPSLMHRFMAEGKLPNFRRLYEESHVFMTDAEEQPPNLEPWIQWVTIHSGLSFQEHGVFHLGDGHKLERPCLWDILSAEGRRVWICGSMNPRYESTVNGYLLPDPWSTAVPPYPAALSPYYRFVQAHVLEHTNERVPLSREEYVEFVRFMTRHGLSLSTLQAIIRQLLREKTGAYRWQRAAILDKLQCDLFRSIYTEVRPHFSTFFSNSTAHFQHMYWRNMEPESFKIRPTDREQAVYEGAILFGYQEMDKLVAEFLNLAEGNVTLMFCTGLSQQPCLKYEDQGGKSFYRPRDFDQFLSASGVASPFKVSPVMSEQFHVYFANSADAMQAEHCLNALEVAGRQVMAIHRVGPTIFAGCSIFDHVEPDAKVQVALAGKTIPFYELFYRVEGLKSGMHHPDGLLWIRKPDHRHTVHEQKVPLTCIAPTILHMLSVPHPGFVRDQLLVA